MQPTLPTNKSGDKLGELARFCIEFSLARDDFVLSDSTFDSIIFFKWMPSTATPGYCCLMVAIYGPNTRQHGKDRALDTEELRVVGLPWAIFIRLPIPIPSP